MKQALVCGKWKLPMLDGKGGFFEDLQPAFTSRRATCFEWLFEGFSKGQSVVDYFGGVGILETIVEHLVEPTEFYIYDLDEDCVRQLKWAFPKATVELADAREVMGKWDADIVLIDHPFLTATRWSEWQEEFDRVFALEPKLVELTVSVRRLPLLRAAWGKVLEAELTDVPSYVTAIAKKLRKDYGYTVTKAAYHFASVYLLIEKCPLIPPTPEFLFVKENTTGFEYLIEE